MLFLSLNHSLSHLPLLQLTLFILSTTQHPLRRSLILSTAHLYLLVAWNRLGPHPDWRLACEKNFGINAQEDSLRSSFSYQQSTASQAFQSSHEPINFLSLLHPSSSPPYHVFVARIIKSSDQQASIFLQQKLKVADVEERAKIVDAICARGFEMMAHR